MSTIEPDPAMEMRATWGQLITTCEQAGLGHVWLTADGYRRVEVCFEHAQSWSWGLTVREANVKGWLQVHGFGERWTDLEALRAYLARRAAEVAERRVA